MQGLHEIMEYYVPSPACSESSFEGVKGTTISKETVDAYGAAVITCLQADGSENAGRHCQKLYNNILSCFPSVAFSQLVHQIRAYVR